VKLLAVIERRRQLFTCGHIFSLVDKLPVPPTCQPLAGYPPVADRPNIVMNPRKYSAAGLNKCPASDGGMGWSWLSLFWEGSGRQVVTQYEETI
jgi:hypothetical protein